MNAQEIIQKSALIEKTLQEQGLQEKASSFIRTEELEKTLKEMQDIGLLMKKSKDKKKNRVCQIGLKRE